MAYFKNLIPELKQDEPQRRPVYSDDPRENRRYELEINPDAPGEDDPAPAPKAAPAAPEGPNVKAQYQKASAQKQQGWTEALKIATDVDAEIDQSALTSEGINNFTAKDVSDIKSVIEKIGSKTQKPSMLADDLRVIASRRTLSPTWSQKLLKAATLLDQADQADQYIEGLKQPGQALALGKPEAAQSAQRLGAGIDAQQGALQGAGSLRMGEAAPALQQDLRNKQALEQYAGVHTTDEPPDINSVLIANGWTKGDLMKRALALQGTLGLNMSQTIAPGAAGMAIVNMLKSMGSVGQALMGQMVKDSTGGRPDPTQKPPPKGGEGAPLQDPYEARIRDREMRFDQAFQELKQLKSFSSMWDVVFYIMFAMMMGPGPAALLFTNKAKKGQLDKELGMLRDEVDSLSRRQESSRRMQESSRQHAATEGLNERRFKHQVEKDDFYMDLRRNSPQGKDPVLDGMMGGYRLWQDELDEAEKVLSNQFDFNEQEIKAARERRAKAVPMVQTARNNIMRYRAQAVQKAQEAPK